MERVSKLFALVIVAFVWAYKAGIFLNEICPIKIKNMAGKDLNFDGCSPLKFRSGLTGNYQATDRYWVCH